MIYELLVQKLTESEKEELSIHDFKEILKYFRVSPRMWLVIRRELNEMGAIKYNRNKIFLKCDGDGKAKINIAKKTK